MLAIILTSCANAGKPDEIRMSAEEGEIFPALVDEKWQDNSMDLYSAGFIRSLNYTEVGAYLEGGIPEDELTKNLTDRVILYLKEQK